MLLNDSRVLETNGILTSDIANITSSAKRLILWEDFARKIPLIPLLDLIDSTKGSTSRENMIGDKRQPWQMPFVVLKGFERKPLTLHTLRVS